jgi:excisionase family DNA binding protein
MSTLLERRYASLAKAARYADCTERTLYNHIKAGEITGYKVGRVYRIDLNEIDEWISRDRKTDDPKMLAAKRDVRASRAEEYIRQLVAEAPPLTEDQRARIAALLRSGGAAA